MKRFDLDVFGQRMEESYEGDYVKYSDVEGLINALKTAHKNACGCCDSSSLVEEHCLQALQKVGIPAQDGVRCEGGE